MAFVKGEDIAVVRIIRQIVLHGRWRTMVTVRHRINMLHKLLLWFWPANTRKVIQLATVATLLAFGRAVRSVGIFITTEITRLASLCGCPMTISWIVAVFMHLFCVYTVHRQCFERLQWVRVVRTCSGELNAVNWFHKILESLSPMYTSIVVHVELYTRIVVRLTRSMWW